MSFNTSPLPLLPPFGILAFSLTPRPRHVFRQRPEIGPHPKPGEWRRSKPMLEPNQKSNAVKTQASIPHGATINTTINCYQLVKARTQIQCMAQCCHFIFIPPFALARAPSELALLAHGAAKGKMNNRAMLSRPAYPTRKPCFQMMSPLTLYPRIETLSSDLKRQTINRAIYSGLNHVRPHSIPAYGVASLPCSVKLEFIRKARLPISWTSTRFTE